MYKIILYSILFLTISVINGQNNGYNQINNKRKVNMEQFTLDMFVRMKNELGPNTNLIMSPLSVWTLLLILREGAVGETARQMTEALRLSGEPDAARNQYNIVRNALQNQMTESIELTQTSALFVDRNQPPLARYENIVRNMYNANVIPVTFQRATETLELIDGFVRKATNDRIKGIVTYDDLKGAELLVTNAVFFKGAWKLPFNKTETTKELFFYENGTIQDQVTMMHRIGPFGYAQVPSIRATVVELPYGDDEKISMYVILPQSTTTLDGVFERLVNVGMDTIYDSIDDAKDKFDDENVNVFLPKFTYASDLIMNVILEKMNITDVFDPNLSDLSNLSNRELHLSVLIHKAEIEVNEDGTIASAASAGALNNRAPPPKFTVNRPFGFFIIERDSKVILFGGKITNVRGLQTVK